MQNEAIENFQKQYDKLGTADDVNNDFLSKIDGEFNAILKEHLTLAQMLEFNLQYSSALTFSLMQSLIKRGISTSISRTHNLETMKALIDKAKTIILEKIKNIASEDRVEANSPEAVSISEPPKPVDTPADEQRASFPEPDNEKVKDKQSESRVKVNSPEAVSILVPQEPIDTPEGEQDTYFFEPGYDDDDAQSSIKNQAPYSSPEVNNASDQTTLSPHSNEKESEDYQNEDREQSVFQNPEQNTFNPPRILPNLMDLVRTSPFYPFPNQTRAFIASLAGSYQNYHLDDLLTEDEDGDESEELVVDHPLVENEGRNHQQNKIKMPEYFEELHSPSHRTEDAKETFLRYKRQYEKLLTLGEVTKLGEKNWSFKNFEIDKALDEEYENIIREHLLGKIILFRKHRDNFKNIKKPNNDAEKQKINSAKNYIAMIHDKVTNNLLTKLKSSSAPDTKYFDDAILLYGAGEHGGKRRDIETYRKELLEKRKQFDWPKLDELINDKSKSIELQTLITTLRTAENTFWNDSENISKREKQQLVDATSKGRRKISRFLDKLKRTYLESKHDFSTQQNNEKINDQNIAEQNEDETINNQYLTDASMETQDDDNDFTLNLNSPQDSLGPQEPVDILANEQRINFSEADNDDAQESTENQDPDSPEVNDAPDQTNSVSHFNNENLNGYTDAFINAMTLFRNEESLYHLVNGEVNNAIQGIEVLEEPADEEMIENQGPTQPSVLVELNEIETQVLFTTPLAVPPPNNGYRDDQILRYSVAGPYEYCYQNPYDVSAENNNNPQNENEIERPSFLDEELGSPSENTEQDAPSNPRQDTFSHYKSQYDELLSLGEVTTETSLRRSFADFNFEAIPGKVKNIIREHFPGKMHLFQTQLNNLEATKNANNIRQRQIRSLTRDKITRYCYEARYIILKKLNALISNESKSIQLQNLIIELPKAQYAYWHPTNDIKEERHRRALELTRIREEISSLLNSLNNTDLDSQNGLSPQQSAGEINFEQDEDEAINNQPLNDEQSMGIQYSENTHLPLLTDDTEEVLDEGVANPQHTFIINAPNCLQLTVSKQNTGNIEILGDPLGNLFQKLADEEMRENQEPSQTPVSEFNNQNSNFHSQDDIGSDTEFPVLDYRTLIGERERLNKKHQNDDYKESESKRQRSRSAIY